MKSHTLIGLLIVILVIAVLIIVWRRTGEKITLNPGVGKDQQVTIGRTNYDQIIKDLAPQTVEVKAQSMELIFYSKSLDNLRPMFLATDDEKVAAAWNAYVESFNRLVRAPNSVKVATYEKREGRKDKVGVYVDVDTEFLRILYWPTYAFLVEQKTGHIIVLYPFAHGAFYRMVNYAGLPGFWGCEKPKLGVYDLVVATDVPTGFRSFAKYTLDLRQTGDPINEKLGWPAEGHAWAFASETGPIRTLVPYKVGQIIYAKPELNKATGSADPWEAAEVIALSYETVKVQFKSDGREEMYHWSWFVPEKEE